MLTRTRTASVLALGLLAAATAIAPATTAQADDGCYTKEIVKKGGIVEVVTICPGEDGGEGSSDGGDAGGGTSGQDERQCVADGKEVPCTTEHGSWDGECYVEVADPQPPKSAPIWGGRTSGVILARTCPGPGDNPWNIGTGIVITIWAPSAPGDTGPSPAELAHQAVAQMNLDMGQIGATPTPLEENPDSLGAVGTPIWLWVDNPGPTTTGPISDSASGGGLTVSATATLESIDYSLTSEHGVTVATTTCSGSDAPGTPYDNRGIVPSPTCGFTAAQNQQIGTYTLTGTAHWVVEWSGGGQSGTITVPGQSGTATIRIGEIQTIITHG